MAKNLVIRKKSSNFARNSHTRIHKFMENFSIVYQQFALLVPPVIFILWALIVKLRRKEFINSLIIGVTGFLLILNGIIMLDIIYNIYTFVFLKAMQEVLSCFIVPLIYYFFSRQVGRAWNNATIVSQIILILLLFMPNLVVDIDPTTDGVLFEPIKQGCINIFSHGHLLRTLYIADLIILVQAFLTIVRIRPLAKTLKKYDLHISSQTKLFVLWWVLAFTFIAGASLVSTEELRTSTGSWVYYISYSLIIISGFVQLALGFDLNPVRTDNDEAVNIDTFIEENKELADKARRIFQEDRLYLKQGILIDDVVSLLGTNRTYFTRMMRAEFGMSFSEYITNERIRYAQKQLLETTDSIDEIAETSGFGTASSFCRVFKRYTETTPEAWRKQHQTEPEKGDEAEEQ